MLVDGGSSSHAGGGHSRKCFRSTIRKIDGAPKAMDMRARMQTDIQKFPVLSLLIEAVRAVAISQRR